MVIPRQSRAVEHLDTGGDGEPATSAQLNRPRNVAVDGNISPPVYLAAKSLAPYRECRGWKTLTEGNKVRAAALSIGAT